MRRSSCITLCVAAVLLLLTAVLYLLSFTTNAPRFTQREAERLVSRGRGAFERGDVDGLLALLAPNARILDRSPEHIRGVLRQAVTETQAGLRVTVRKVTAQQSGRTGFATALIDVGQRTKGMSATYYSGVTLRFTAVPVRESHWLGLYSTEDWRIQTLESDTGLDVPVPGL